MVKVISIKTVEFISKAIVVQLQVMFESILQRSLFYHNCKPLFYTNLTNLWSSSLNFYCAKPNFIQLFAHHLKIGIYPEYFQVGKP